MSASREYRVIVLILLFAISIVMIWRPWAKVDPAVEETFGWPSHYVRGLTFGVDFVGGSRIMLKLESSHVTVELPAENTVGAYDAMLDALVEKLCLPSRPVPVDPETDRMIDYYDQPTRVVTIEIGLSVKEMENLVRSIIGDCGGEVKYIESAVCIDTREEIIDSLKNRVDPLDVLKVRFKPMGADFLLFEVRLEPERAKALLGHQGRLEVFIENKLVLFGDDITHVDPISIHSDPATERRSWCVPFGLSSQGVKDWIDATSPPENFVGCPTGIYLDRLLGAISGEPLEAILFLSEQLRKTAGLDYCADENLLYLQPRLPLLIKAVEVGENFSLEFLEKLGTGTRIILLDSEGEFENVVPELENKNFKYSLERAPRPPEDWLDLRWVKEDIGLKSAPIISEGVAGKLERPEMVITTGGIGEAQKKEAETLRDILSRRLPVRISYESETFVDPRFGSGFLREAILTALVALAGVWTLIYFRYKHPQISLALIGTMLCEFVITVGIAAILGLTLELPELGGLIVVIGTGVDHQIIITDELLRGGLPRAERVSLRGRAGRAFMVIFAAAATTMAAMTMLGTLGFGVMRGFAIITIVGTLMSLLVTRPVYARMASAILAKPQPEVRRGKEH